MEWLILFQSPRSGQICSNITAKSGLEVVTDVFEFQSPRSGQICSNKFLDLLPDFELNNTFQSPRSGQICSNDEAADDTIRFDD